MHLKGKGDVNETCIALFWSITGGCGARNADLAKRDFTMQILFQRNAPFRTTKVRVENFFGPQGIHQLTHHADN